MVTDDPLFDIPDAQPVFYVGFTITGPKHAIADSAEITEAMTTSAVAKDVHGVCGAWCRLATQWAPWAMTNPHLALDRCSYCSWHVALTQDTTASLLGALHPDLAMLCRVILDVEQGPTGEYDQDHPRLIELLAHATDHGPWRLVGEDCADGGCGHDEGQCPETIACQSCSLTAGGWAGEWAGDADPVCTVPAPCSVTAQLTSYYLTPSKERAPAGLTQAPLL